MKFYVIHSASLFFSDKTVGFSAYRTTPLSNHHGKTVIYNATQTNKDSGYNTATGIFTAPVAGTYVFLWNAMTNRSGHNFCALYLYRNGARLNFKASSYMVGDIIDSSSNSAVLTLAIGDIVGIITGYCYYFVGHPYTSFSGFKI